MTNAITSIGAAGTVAATAASGAAIATIPAASLSRAGSYEFTIQMTALAAGAAADVNNVVLTLGSSTLVVPLTPAAGPQGQVKLRGVLDGSTAASLNVGGAATTIAYYGTIYAEYLGAGGSNLLHR